MPPKKAQTYYLNTNLTWLKSIQMFSNISKTRPLPTSTTKTIKWGAGERIWHPVGKLPLQNRSLVSFWGWNMKRHAMQLQTSRTVTLQWQPSNLYSFEERACGGGANTVHLVNKESQEWKLYSWQPDHSYIVATSRLFETSFLNRLLGILQKNAVGEHMHPPTHV